MAAETNILSQSITALDSGATGAPAPASVPRGKGAKSYLYEIDDYVSVDATGIQTAGSYYRLLRLPVTAYLKSLQIVTDRALDSGTPTLAFDVGLAFSDSLYDGTSALQRALIPTTANDGTCTTFAAYSTPNKVFGGITAAQLTNSAKYVSGNLLFNGITSGYPMASLAGKMLWELFNFVDGRGYPMAPAGMFDVYVYATTGANVGVAGKIWAKADFIA